MRIAILGCGSIGCRHLRNLQSLGYTDLAAFDPLPEACQRVQDEFKVVSYIELDQIWRHQPQVALITAPSNLHVELALTAAQHGCHLFIEKPLSHSIDGLDMLCTEIQRRSLVTMVACNMRFHPGPMRVKRLIEEGVIGPVIAARIQTGSYLPGWRPQQDYHQSYSASPEWGGAILDCIHEIDLTLWYFGPASVVGAAQLPASAIGLATDGVAEIILHHQSGVLSNVHLNFVQRDYRRTCQVIGREGTIYWDFSDHHVKVYGVDGELAQAWPEPQGWQLNQMYSDELDHFLGAIKQGTETINPITGGIMALEIALAAREAKRDK